MIVWGNSAELSARSAHWVCIGVLVIAAIAVWMR
jgi:hypothetical protein